MAPAIAETHVVYKMHTREMGVTDRIVTLKLNQQQLELIDRTIAQGLAADRASLVRLALREYASKRAAATGDAK